MSVDREVHEQFNNVEARLSFLVERIDALETIISQFVQSYSEMHAVLTVVADRVVTTMSDDEVTTFQRDIGNVQAAIAQMMQDAMNDVARHNPRTASSVQPVAEPFDDTS